MGRIGIKCKMQQIGGGGGGHFINVKKTHACMLHIILLRAHFFSQKEKYWYEIRDVLVPNFHAL